MVVLIIDQDKKNKKSLIQYLNNLKHFENLILHSFLSHKIFLSFSNLIKNIDLLIYSNYNKNYNSIEKIQQKLLENYNEFETCIINYEDFHDDKTNKNIQCKIIHSPLKTSKLEEIIQEIYSTKNNQNYQQDPPPSNIIDNNLLEDYKESAKKYCPHDYKIEEYIKQDQLTYIYSAIQISINRPLTLHILKPNLLNELNTKENLQNEIKNKAQIIHDHIETIYDGGIEKENIFYSHQSFQGKTIHKLIKEDYTFNENEISQILSDISSVFTYIQKLNITTNIQTIASNIISTSEYGYCIKNRVTSLKSVNECSNIKTLAKTLLQLKITNKHNNLNTLLNNMLNNNIDDWEQINNIISNKDFNNNLTSSTNKKNPKSGKYSPFYLPILILLIIGFFLISFLKKYIFKNNELINPMIKISRSDLQNKQKFPEFYISKYEVTIGQYEKFLLELNSHTNPKIFDHINQPKTKTNHFPKNWNNIINSIKSKSKHYEVKLTLHYPIFNVDWWDAYAFAKYKKCRLPTAEEWEISAFGKNKAPYPWGSKFNPKFLNSGYDFTNDKKSGGEIDGYKMWCPVNIYLKDISPTKVTNLAGNVTEWTNTWDNHPFYPDKKIPSVRGGSFISKNDFTINIKKTAKSPNEQLETLGFRIASD